MALSLFLRNSQRIKVFPSLLRTSTFPLIATFDSRKSFSQVLSQTSLCKNVSVSSNSKINFVIPKRTMAGDHSKMWAIEKIIAFALLGVVPATFLFPNAILDDVFAILIVSHFFWGLEACVFDYARPIILGPILPKLIFALLYIISGLTLGGLLYFNHTCIGIGCTACRIWEIKE